MSDGINGVIGLMDEWWINGVIGSMDEWWSGSRNNGQVVGLMDEW